MNKLYKVLFFINLLLVAILNISICIIDSSNMVGYYFLNFFLVAFIVLVVLSIVKMIKNKKVKVNKLDISVLILFIVYILCLALIAALYNKNAVIPYIHLNYYLTFINVGYILVNIYTISLFNLTKK